MISRVLIFISLILCICQVDGQVAAPIIVRGNKLYNAKTKERFVIVGVRRFLT